MDVSLFISFTLVSIAFIAIPGPNVLLIISTSLNHGKVSGLHTVVGTSTAMAVQLTVAAIGTSWLVNTLATGFYWLKWAGVCYLLFIGSRHLLAAFLPSSTALATNSNKEAFATIQTGFWISLFNPKTILFFAAFLPQFANTTGSYSLQIATLSLMFWLLATLIDSCYALLAAQLRLRLDGMLLNQNEQQRSKDGLSGLLYLLAGVLLSRVNLERI